MGNNENLKTTREPRPLSSFSEGDVVYYNSHYYHHFFLLKERKENYFAAVSLPVYEDFTFTAALHFNNTYVLPPKPILVWDSQEWLDEEVDRVEKERASILRSSDKLYSEINKHKEKQKKE